MTQPLREQLEHLIQSHSANTGVDRPGGVYLAQRGSDPGGRPDAPAGRGECGDGGGPRDFAPAIGRAAGSSRVARAHRLETRSPRSFGGAPLHGTPLLQQPGRFYSGRA